MLPATLLLLSVTTNVPARAPLAPGVKTTAIAQVDVTVSVVPQVVFWLKSVELVPVNVMLVMFSVAVPVLLSVKELGVLPTAAAWLPKLKLDGERPASGAVPVPVKLTVCGLLVALSVKVKVAVRLPAVVGEKFTLTVQVPFTPSGLAAVQVLLGMAKSPGLVPVI